MKQWIGLIKKVLRNGGLFALLLALTYRWFFRKVGMEGLLGLLDTLDWRRLAAALLAVAAMYLTESLTIFRNLALLGGQPRYGRCILYAAAGNFFSAVTPAATGGQPMQLWYMRRDGIGTAPGTMTLMMEFVAYQTAILTLALGGCVFWFGALRAAFGRFFPMLWIGMALNAALLALTLCAIFSDTLIDRLIAFAARAASLFRRGRQPAFAARAHGWAEQYRGCAAVLRRNAGACLANVGLTVFRVALMHSIPFWVYLSMGLSGHSLPELLALQAAVYLSCAVLPMPGSVGVSESLFSVCFRPVFRASALSGAMLLSRGIVLYLPVMLCGLLLCAVGLPARAGKGETA